MQPPQNPYNQPNYGQPQQPFAPAPQQPRGTVSLDVIGEAWKLVQPSIGQWALALLIVGALVFVVNIISSIIQAPFSPRQGQSPGLMFYMMLLVAQVIGAVIQGVALAALYRMAIANIRTGKADLNQMFGVTEVLAPVLVASILVYLATIVGFVLCIVPGIIAALGLTMTQPLIVDQKLAPVDAMKASWAGMKPHLGSLFVLGFVLGLLNFAGALACGVGLFVTVPIYVVAMALVYRDVFGAGGAPTQNTGYTPPPIANPNF